MDVSRPAHELKAVGKATMCVCVRVLGCPQFEARWRFEDAVFQAMFFFVSRNDVTLLVGAPGPVARTKASASVVAVENASFVLNL